MSIEVLNENGNGIPEPTDDDLAAIERKIQLESLTEIRIPDKIEVDDNFRMYLRDLPKVGPKSLEESLALGKRIKESGPDAKEAKDELACSCMRMVVSVAIKRKVLGTDTPIMDLISEGNIGLCMATEKYDYKRGVKFSTFAMWLIEQKIKQAAIEDAGPIKIPQQSIYPINRVEKIRGEIKEETGCTPSIKELAKRANLLPHQVERLLKTARLKSVISLSSPVADKDGAAGSELGDFIEDKDALNRDGLDDNLDSEALKKLCGELMFKLTPKQERAFLLKHIRGLTYRKVGEIMGISPTAAKILERKAVAKLKNSSVAEKLRPFVEERPDSTP